MNLHRIDSSPAVNALIAQDAEYGVWVLKAIRRHGAEDYEMVVITSDYTMGVYYAPRYDGNLCITTYPDRTYIELNSERIDRYEQH